MGCKVCLRRALPRLARRAVLCSCKLGRLWYTRFSLSPSSRGLGRRPFKAKIAGSNPAGGTIEATSPVPSRCRAFCQPAPGVEPGGRETERTRERSPASVRGRKAPGAAGSCGSAQRRREPRWGHHRSYKPGTVTVPGFLLARAGGRTGTHKSGVPFRSK